MKNFLELVRDDRQLRSLIGLDKNTFEKLLEEFSKSLLEIPNENYKKNRSQRKRRPGGGRKGQLITAENKLCLVLFYLKNYPTFDLLGYIFSLSRSKAKENLSKLLPVLKHAQSKLEVLPSLRIKSVTELEELVEKLELEELEELKEKLPEKKRLRNESEPDSSLEVEPEEFKNSQKSDSFPSSLGEETVEAVPLTNESEPDSSPEDSVEPKVVQLGATNSSESDSLQLKELVDKKPSRKTNLNRSQEPEVLNRSKEVAQNPKELDVKLEKSTNNDEQELYIDVTERNHYRPKNYREQKRYYSGKSKKHVVKNTIISSRERKILYVGPSFVGRTHDYKMFKKEFSPKKDWFRKINVAVDLGYQGIKKDYRTSYNINIPHKKPRKSSKHPNPSLTRKQKSENKKVSSRRVVVEHAIGGMKAFKILSSQFRNKTKNLADEAIYIVAGLWNLKISD